MKKEKLIALLTVICMMTTPVFAETGLKIAGEKKDDVIALKDLGISVTADHYTTVREDDDGFVYFYTIEDDSIPYVIVGQYDYASDDFADDFTKYMNDQYDDLKETSKDSITINGLDFDRVTYEYTVSGYDAKDTRLFHAMDDSTYMFGIKEVPELDYTVDYDYLEDIAGSMKPLEDDEYKNYVDSEHDITEEKKTKNEEEASKNLKNDNIEEKDENDDIHDNKKNVEDEINDQNEDEMEEKDEKKGIGSILGSNENEDDDDEERMEAEGDYIHFKESMASWKGTWVPFEDGFKLYLPNTWNEFILSDEQKDAGTIYQAGDAKAVDGENAPYISVNYGPTQGLETMEEVKDDMEYSGYDIDGIVDVNGIECLSYSYDDPNLAGMMFFYPGRTDYVFAVVGYNYDDFEDVLGPVLCSLSLS